MIVVSLPLKRQQPMKRQNRKGNLNKARANERKICLCIFQSVLEDSSRNKRSTRCHFATLSPNINTGSPAEGRTAQTPVI